jgi:alpha-L-rhamnosidase
VPTVAFHHGAAGRRISMRAGFLLDPHPSSGPSGQVSAVHGNQHTDLSYSYVQRGGRETFHPFDYLGFRYLQIDRPGETLTRGDVVALTRHAAVPDAAGARFSSPDRTVNAVFELGRHSALFTAQEQFIDTPTREKGPWLWDGFNESQTAMAAFGEQNLTRKSLLEFAQSQARYWPQGRINKIYPTGLGAQDINEFSEIYPEWVWQYWLATGDRSLLEAVYPTITNLADYVAAAIDPATGLVTRLPSTSIYYKVPVVTRLNVLGTNVFRRAADVAAALGRPADDIGRHRARQVALSAAINTRLTRSDGIYVDGRRADGSPTTEAGQEANTAAVAYGVVPAAREQRVAAHVARLGMTNPPRTAGEVLETLRLAGRGRDLLTRLTNARTPGWANLLARGATFTWEVWDPSDVIGDSMSHGWGANVLVEVQRGLLGLEPTGPGYATFAVAPPRDGLPSASGRVPTPRGVIAINWRRGTGPGAWTLDLTVPANATATVRLPAVNAAHLTEGGHPLHVVTGVRLVGTDHGTATLEVGAGTYHLRAS